MTAKYRHTVKQKKGRSAAKKKSGIKIILLLFVIGAVTFISFSPSLNNEFTNWDDPVYVIENPLLTNLASANIKKIFTTPVSSNYHPFTILSLAIEYHYVQLEPKLYHTTNVIIHLLNALLVFWFIYRLCGNYQVAVFVSLLFGVHPMHVESVSWISERKDVLYTFFFMAGAIAYLKYLEEKKGRGKYYILMFVLFVCSLLSKSAAVVFPVVLWLLDFIKKRPFSKKVVLEKVPLLLLSLLFGLIAVYTQREKAIAGYETFALHHRALFASYGIIVYLWKLIAPLNLSCFYPYPFLIGDRLPYIFYFAPAIVGGMFALIWWTKKYTRDVIFGFLFFLVTIVFVLQFMSVGRAVMADRYTYVPYIGIFFIIGKGYHYVITRKEKKYLLLKVLLFLLLAGYAGTMAYLTYERTQVWKNSGTLWTDVIKNHPKELMAYSNRGNYYSKKGMYDKALIDYNALLGAKPKDFKSYVHRANVYGIQKKYELAIVDYTKALSINANYADAYVNRGITYSIMKQYKKAFEDYSRAIALQPGKTSIYVNRAYAYLENGNYEQAINDYDFLTRKEPYENNHYFYRGLAYHRSGNYEAAMKDYTHTLQLNAENGGAYLNRSLCYNAKNDYLNALNDAVKAKQLGQKVDDSYIDKLRGLTGAK